MPFIRSIGRWAMTALVVNAIIGGGIFGLPSELTRLLGCASPIAFAFGALAMAIIILCFAEVSSQFSEPGGPYLYVRTAFGRLAGTQIAWFHLLGTATGGAAEAALFMAYLAGVLPWASAGWQRILLLTVLIAIPTLANYVGVRIGKNFTSALTLAKLLPLVLIICLGLLRLGKHFEMPRAYDITSHGHTTWLQAWLLLIFAYVGIEDALIPAGEVKDPRRTLPFALLAGLLICTITYTLVQFVTVATIGTRMTNRPLADTAAVLMGGSGVIVTFAVMIATYGCLSGMVLHVPRLTCSLALQGDFPNFFGKLHPRFNTPTNGILLFAGVVWLIAATGTFLWAAVISGAASIFIYSGTSAALIRLRQRNPHADALRLPYGRAFAILAIVIAASLLLELDAQQALLMGITALIAIANWWWATRRDARERRLRKRLLQRVLNITDACYL